MQVAKLLGKYQGKKVYRFPVKVTFIGDDLLHIPCVQIEVFGPKGGCASHAYWGWDRAIFFQMDREQARQEREARQLRLPFVMSEIRKEAA